jgi:ABC-2 type transport system permease protein
MGVVRDTYIIFKKDMLIWFKNPVAPVIRSLIFPLLWIVIFGTAFGGDVEHIPVALVQEDFGPHSQDMISELIKNEVLSITTTTNYATANEMLKKKKVSGLIFIPPGFSDSIEDGARTSIQLSLDETAPQISTALTLHVFEAARVFSDRISVERLSEMGVPGEVLDPVTVEQNTLIGRGNEYLLGVIMDREFGTLKMLMAAPVSRNSIILGKIFAGVIQTIASGIVALTVAMAMGVNLKAGAFGFLLIILLMFIAGFGFIGMSTAIGVRIGQLEGFMVVMQVIIMPMWFLSGGLYPMETMPPLMRFVASINPITYAIDAVRSIMIRGIIWDTLILDFVVLIGFSLSMFALGSLAFRRTID